MDDLSHQLQGLQPLLRGLGQPIGFLVRRVQKRAGGERVLVDLDCRESVHGLKYSRIRRLRKLGPLVCSDAGRRDLETEFEVSSLKWEVRGRGLGGSLLLLET